MRRISLWTVRAVTIILAAGLVLSRDAVAFDFKTISTAGLGDGGARFVHVSPFNVNTAMETTVFEFVTNVADSWRCGITQNNTGQDLTVRLVNLLGFPVASCVTPVNGTCATPFVGLVGGFAFTCTVSGGTGSPVALGSHITFFVQR